MTFFPVSGTLPVTFSKGDVPVMRLGLAILFATFALSGCYQIHSDDDLRTIPVTNNPNIVPNQGQRLTSAPI